MSKGGTLGVGYKSKGKVGELWVVCRKVQDGPSGEGGSDGLLKFQREKGWEFWGFVNGLRGGEGGPQELFHSSQGPLSLRAPPCTGWLIHQNGSLLKDLKKALKGLPNNRCKAFQRPIPGGLRKTTKKPFQKPFSVLSEVGKQKLSTTTAGGPQRPWEPPRSPRKLPGPPGAPQLWLWIVYGS